MRRKASRVTRTTLGNGSPRETLPDGLEVRPIPGLEDYAASADGRIWAMWSNPPMALTTREHRGVKGHVYLRVRLSVAGRIADRYVARLVAEAWMADSKPIGGVVSHLDRGPLCCAVDNLAWRAGEAVVTDSEFVLAWQSASSAAEVADILGLTYATVMARAGRLRKKGVPLRAFSCHDMSIEELTRLTTLGDENDE